MSAQTVRALTDGLLEIFVVLGSFEDEAELRLLAAEVEVVNHVDWTGSARAVCSDLAGRVVQRGPATVEVFVRRLGEVRPTFEPVLEAILATLSEPPDDPPSSPQPPSRPEIGGEGPVLEPRTGLAFASIPAGRFTMGTDLSDWRYRQETPQHEVRITRTFLLATTPVTNAAWLRYLQDTRAPWTPLIQEAETRPVVGVSRRDANAFCEWAGMRLPTEAEWEHACRAGTTTRYWSGSTEADLRRVGWYAGNSGGRRPTRRMPPNPWGLHDMHGGVREWCADWYARDYYARSPVDDPRGPDRGNEVVVRGGSYRDDAGRVRSASRRGMNPAVRLDALGFRPVLLDTPQG